MTTNTDDRAEFIHCAEAFMATCAPELDFNRADLFSWIAAAWPYNGTPEDAASEFAESVTTGQNNS